jgi:hypothetical protein
MNTNIGQPLNKVEYVKLLQTRLSKVIGWRYWKKYIAASFWANISTPINLTLTLTSTIISAQTSTGSFIEQRTAIILSFVAVLLSTINTFFKPLSNMNKSIVEMNHAYTFGNRFEKIYYDKHETDEQLNARIEEYKQLLFEINEYSTKVSPDDQNFITDLIHLIVRSTCLEGKEEWLFFVHENKNKNRKDQNKGCFSRIFSKCFTKVDINNKSQIELEIM